MGRGPGERQQRVLSTLGRHPFFYFADLVGPDASAAEYSAMSRAVKTLERRGDLITVRLEYGLMVLRDEAVLREAVLWELRDFLSEFIPDSKA